MTLESSNDGVLRSGAEHKHMGLNCRAAAGERCARDKL